MYDYLDRPLRSLGSVEQFLVAAMRTWVMARCQGRCAVRAIEPMFRASESTEALGAFHCLMAVTGGSARCPLRFCHPACPNIAEGEALLLALISAATVVGPEELAQRCGGLVGANREAELAFVVDRLAGALAEVR